ncbi:MAG: DUF5996 family protein [Desulfobacterales bacterium]
MDSAFQGFRGGFTGKSAPPHLFWHHFDLALTRFSGRPGPVREGVNIVEREDYSHQVISFGYWLGDAIVRQPAFYGYAYPVSDGLYEQTPRPQKAFWNKEMDVCLLAYSNACFPWGVDLIY